MSASEIVRVLRVDEITAHEIHDQDLAEVVNSHRESVLAFSGEDSRSAQTDPWFHAPWISSKTDRTYGGQLVGQAIAAANATVSHKHLHSLHTYFLQGGDPKIGVDLLVELVRDGRSFSNRRVCIFQRGVEICQVGASYHRAGDAGPTHGHPMPGVPHPDTTPREVFADFSESETLEHSGDWDGLVVPQEKVADNFAPGNRLSMWIRYNGEVPDDSNFHAAALSYISDSTLLSTTTSLEPKRHVQMASLDHSMWMFEPFRVDDWLLYDQWSPEAGAGRGFAMGRFYRGDGTLVAMATQEGLVRDHR